MDLELSEDQANLRDELRRFLDAEVTSAQRRAAADLAGAVDGDLWAALSDLGVFTVPVPEDLGGVGLGWAEATIAFEELGRAAVPGPLVGTAVARVHGIDAGVVGLVERATPAMVEHADALDALLVVDGAGCTVVHEVGAATRDGDVVPRPLDPLTPITVVPQLPDGDPVVDAGSVRREAALLAAAQQVGLADAAIAMAVAYAGERTQFGRAIGSFQALKHLLADAAVGVEVARAAVHAAAVTLDEGGGAGGHHSVEAARLVASDAARRATSACIQVHGGIGYTWELDAHLFLKRVLVLDQTPMTPDAAQAAIAANL